MLKPHHLQLLLLIWRSISHVNVLSVVPLRAPAVCLVHCQPSPSLFPGSVVDLAAQGRRSVLVQRSMGASILQKQRFLF